MIYAYEILWHTFYRWLSVSIQSAGLQCLSHYKQSKSW